MCKVFHVRQSSKRITLVRAKQEWQTILKDHEHASFYVFPFARHVQLHTWDKTDDKKTALNEFLEYLSNSWATFSAVWVGDLLARTVVARVR